MAATIAFLPARCGSKSIRFKNIKSFCGKPLLYWSLNALSQCEEIDEIYVATDCEKIEKVVDEFHLPKVKVYDRDPENATDSSSTEAVMLEFINRKGLSPDNLFMLVQATSPFTTTEDFHRALVLFREENADSLLSATTFKRFLWNRAGQSINYDYMNRPLRQHFDGSLMENGAFYISTVKNILKYGNRLGGKVSLYQMPDFTSLELDEPVDWVIGEKLMEEYVLSPIRKTPSEIKLVASDVDGVLTDAGMYYADNGNELKKFNTHDGKGFELLRNQGIKTAIITSENTQIVEQRAAKLKVDYLFQGLTDGGKLSALSEICAKEQIDLKNVAYIGDDINCREALENVGLAACPADALPIIKNIPGIKKLSKRGGEGAFREFVEIHILRTDWYNYKAYPNSK